MFQSNDLFIINVYIESAKSPKLSVRESKIAGNQCLELNDNSLEGASWALRQTIGARYTWG